MKKLIVNGDDFGLSPETNRGLIEAHQHGILTSATLLTNMLGFEDAVVCAKKNPGLGVGIHLNLTTGKPLSSIGKVSRLVDSKGNFDSCLFRFFTKNWFKKIDSKQIKVELDTQIKKFLNSGLKPTHIDTHHHIILRPKVYYVVIDLMDKYKIRKFRFYHSHRAYFSGKKKYFKKILLCLNLNKSKNNKYQMPDYIFDLENVSLGKRLFQIRNGINEIISHPSCAGKEIKNLPRLAIRREKELRELTDPSVWGIIKNQRIKLTNYEKF